MHHSKPSSIFHLILYSTLLVALALPTFAASASIHICRTDPIVYLSNGMKAALWVNIKADPSDIDLITYTLHVPAGLEVTRVVYTGGALVGKEKLVVIADNLPGRVSSFTQVTTDLKRVEVTATTFLFGSSFDSVSGYGNEALAIDLVQR